jgi:hypothetical protein
MLGSRRGALLGVMLLSGLLGGVSLADDRGNYPGPVASLRDLRYMNERELRNLYVQAPTGTRPLGYVRGAVLHLDRTLFPRVQIGLTRVIWRGKYFTEQRFVNQWTGFRAIDSQVQEGPSYVDGRPCMILEYPPGTPFFGRMRDEVRQVGPNVYVAMVFEKTNPPRFRGIIGLESQARR